ncbi:PBAN-type neuropeptides-like [Zootermopsis nevadensis]|uniref:FXPRL-amide n=1 Tax=Zootermopsis nevadensis TaxID=136037 RepID=A0A067QIM9_ZOONE|nr:PBAN-type neuropeptides-like [Zootermopsis nevadensis]KDR07140.1 PBAN-type neuropeptide [Zootermopsis nevadensis]
MRTDFSTQQHLIHTIVLLCLVVALASCDGFRLSSDPLEDGLLLGLEGLGDDPLAAKRGEPEVTGMWFGPRLGRREKRSVDDFPEDVADIRVEEVMELLKDTPWALLPLRGGKRHIEGFVPRLGRDSNEDEDADMMEQRSPPFAPRLGRRLVPFRPRMGRDRLPHDVYSPRLGRSVPHEKKQTPPHH